MTVGGLRRAGGPLLASPVDVTVAQALALLAHPIDRAAPEPTAMPAPEILQRLVAGRIGVVGFRPPGQARLDAHRRSPKPIPGAARRHVHPAAAAARRLGNGDHAQQSPHRPRDRRGDACLAVVSSAPDRWRASRLADARTDIRMRAAEGFTIDAAALATLRDATFSLRGDAEVRFQRAPAGRRAFRCGPGRLSRWRGSGSRSSRRRSTSRRSCWSATRRSRASRVGAAQLSPARRRCRRGTRIATSTPGWLGPDGPLAALVTPADRFVGRNWAGRFHVLFDNAGPFAPDDRLYVVESRDDGTRPHAAGRRRPCGCRRRARGARR